MNGKKYQVYKRIFDLVFSLIGIIITWPIMLVIFIILFLQLRHFPIFIQKRLGKNGKRFSIYKFQTMCDNSDVVFENLPIELKRQYYNNYKIDNDPRVTKIGRVLRKFALDELPQLVNVLKGEMSIVGPRPIIEEELPKYKNVGKRFLTVKPGMTGYWQVNGHNKLTYNERIKLDMYYIDNASLRLDVKIIIKTFGIIIYRIGI